jgi:hypothetical protein
MKQGITGLKLMCITRHIVFVLNLIACGIVAFGLPMQTRAQDGSNPKLEPKVAAGAVDAFKVALDERWSYRHANGADFDAAIATLRKRIAAGITRDDLSC